VPDLQTAVTTALRAAGLKATISNVARSHPYSVVIDIRSSEAGPTCASALHSQLVAEVEGVPEADKYGPPGQWGSLLRGFMPLLQDQALVIASPVEHDADVQRAVHSAVAAMAAKIKSADRPRP
jgi:hypothetical protein